MAAVLFFCVCLLASAIGGISGIGGGVIIKPALEMVSGYSVETISFLSGVTVLSMALVSVLMQAKGKQVAFEFRRGTLLAVGSVLGGIAGKLLFDFLSAQYGGNFLGAVQSSLLVCTLVVLILLLALGRYLHPHNLQGGIPCLLLGTVMGALSAFLGIGGGPLNIAILTLCFAMDTKKAAAHSIYIILFSQFANLLLTLARQTVPEFTSTLLASVILGGILGGFAGRRISRYLSNQVVGRLYGCILVFVLIISATNFFGYLQLQ